jgi:membrane-bound metal-dependent hydrolase YbcI (DUF457 family)
MNIIAHAGASWLLAEAGRGDERFRRAVFLAGVLPDLDGITYSLGFAASLNQHHIWTHNIFFGLLCSLLAALYCKGYRFRVFLFAQLAFYAHFFGDYFFTQWPLAFWWPISGKTYISKHAFPYFSPINTWLIVAALVLFILLAIIFKRPPLEVFTHRWVKHLMRRNKP